MKSIDPMVGFLDRIVASGNTDRITMARNIPLLVQFELSGRVSIAEYRRHVIENGYASKETAYLLWPVGEFPE